MKKSIFLALTVCAVNLSSVFASQIRSYDALKLALNAGAQINIALDLAECMKSPDMPKGFFTPTALMLSPATATTKEHVTTSHLHFTDRAGVPTYEYIKYTINSDGTVEIKASFYDPKTFKPLGATSNITCIIGQGIQLFTP